MRLDWPDCHNARDLGGLRTADGQTVRRGALIRSDRLDRLTEAGVAAVRAHGVSRIIDLRGASEISRQVHPFAGAEVYRHLPFIDEEADRRRDPVAEATLIGIYRASIHRNRATVVELQACHPEIILDLLDHIDESYGGPGPYLAGIGVTPDRLATLRARLLA